MLLVGDQAHLIPDASLKVTKEMLPGESWKACNRIRVAKWTRDFNVLASLLTSFHVHNSVDTILR